MVRTVINLREQASPHTATMADSAQENVAYVMDILGSLEIFEGESKKDKNKGSKEAFKTRTTDMEVITKQPEMGKVCVQFQNVQHYRNQMQKVCKKHAGLSDVQSLRLHALDPEGTDNQRHDDWNDRADQEEEELQI